MKNKVSGERRQNLTMEKDEEQKRKWEKVQEI